MPPRARTAAKKTTTRRAPARRAPVADDDYPDNGDDIDDIDEGDDRGDTGSAEENLDDIPDELQISLGEAPSKEREQTPFAINGVRLVALKPTLNQFKLFMGSIQSATDEIESEMAALRFFRHILPGMAYTYFENLWAASDDINIDDLIGIFSKLADQWDMAEEFAQAQKRRSGNRAQRRAANRGR